MTPTPPRWLPCVVCGLVEAAHARGCVVGCTQGCERCRVCPGACWAMHLFESDRAVEPYRIGYFRGEYAYLSNFHPAPTAYEGVVYPTSEHAFQAAKRPAEQRTALLTGNPGQAKRLGREGACRPDWEEVKDEVMRAVLWAKFAGNALGAAFLATGHVELVEGNDWGDRTWGVVGGYGENRLGQALMTVRAGLRRLNAAAP